MCSHLPEPDARTVRRQAQAVLDFHGPDSDAGLVYERLGNVTNPTLVLAGGQDHVDPISADVAIADAVPGAVLVQVPML